MRLPRPGRWLRIARVVVPVVVDALMAARDLRDFRARVARAAQRGDLDDAVQISGRTLEVVEDYVENG